MVHFPIRKCYQVGKVSVVLILVVTLFGFYEHWRGGKRGSVASYLDPLEMEYERQILEDEARIIPGLGDGGVAAQLAGEELRLGQESEKKLAMNVYLSDRIAYNRTLEDHRNPACQRVIYDAELPSASVVVIFHNEPYSVVVRTVWSVINSARRDRPWHQRANYVDRATGRAMTLGYPGQPPDSPLVYLKEIILVDDSSTLPELRGKLSHYVRTRLPPGLVRILRLPQRVGLTQARLAGARYAVGDALIFLDAHCETQPDWLRPLLQRIKDDPHAVVMPIIDVIEAADFYYSVQDPSVFQGLMLARSFGARRARGDVLVFLDAHCEVGADWLRPLLQRITHKRDAVITPLIDVVDQTSFGIDAVDTFQVGGFNFMGHFTWIDVGEKELKRRGSDVAPTWSPTMAGGLFAINRQYYWELGGYDEQMAGWGGENLEMSFRVWQCGGSLETVPCSRVGHVFRAFHPYGLPASTDTHGINTARMAEVWMDDYKELFYLHRPDLRNNPLIGDVTHRKVLREKLRCKSFQWYLDNIYPDKFVPVRDAYGFGRFRNPATGLCLDTLQREGANAALGVYPCHTTLQPTQYLSLANGRLRDEERCVTLEHTRRDESLEQENKSGRRLLMVDCRPQNGQQWRYLPSKQLRHESSGLCLDAGWESGSDARATPCRPAAPGQMWTIDYTEDNGFKMGTGPPSDLELKLQKLRGLRRVGRSLLAAEQSVGPRRHKKKHRRNKKHSARSRKSRAKNRFILKLVRARVNGSAEHLEVDVHCRHRKLLPNNTFVRDLVALLTDHDIEVINNGRVFERNKVTELASGALRRGPATNTTTGTPPQPKSLQPKMWPKKKRRPLAVAPANKIIVEDFVEVTPNDRPAPPQPQLLQPKVLPKKKRRPLAMAPVNKIIVEDFVEVPTDKSAMPPVSPVFKRHPPRPAYSTRVKLAVDRSAPSSTPPPASAEQTPPGGLASDEITLRRGDNVDSDVDGNSNEFFAGVATHERANESEVHPAMDSNILNDIQDETHVQTRGRERPERVDRSDHAERAELDPQRAELDPQPLKVVMRSNLSFNLGNEFFKWRNGDDVNDILGQLAIPLTRVSPDPSTDSKDPGTDSNEPITDSKDPSTDSKDPITDSKDPITGSKNPITGSKNPSTDSKDPSTDSKDPSTDSKKPITDSRPSVIIAADSESSSSSSESSQE